MLLLEPAFSWTKLYLHMFWSQALGEPLLGMNSNNKQNQRGEAHPCLLPSSFCTGSYKFTVSDSHRLGGVHVCVLFTVQFHTGNQCS